jgi:hypothetical protein
LSTAACLRALSLVAHLLGVGRHQVVDLKDVPHAEGANAADRTAWGGFRSGRAGVDVGRANSRWFTTSHVPLRSGWISPDVSVLCGKAKPVARRARQRQRHHGRDQRARARCDGRS